MDYTTIHPLCESQARLIDLHLWRSAPLKSDENHPIQIPGAVKFPWSRLYQWPHLPKAG